MDLKLYAAIRAAERTMLHDAREQWHAEGHNRRTSSAFEAGVIAACTLGDRIAYHVSGHIIAHAAGYDWAVGHRDKYFGKLMPYGATNST